MTDDLIAFIRTRLDEDERVANAVNQPQDWRAGSGEDQWDDPEIVFMWPPEFQTPYESDKHWRGLQSDDEAQAAHIARHDPGRVLRGVEAKRRILAVHRPGKEVSVGWTKPKVLSCEGCGFGGPCDDPHTEDINECPTLLAVASEWSDHPDYRPEVDATSDPVERQISSEYSIQEDI